MVNKPLVLIASLVGIILGVLSSNFILVGSWLSLVLWSIIGILIGSLIKERRVGIISGIFYGSFLTLSFLLSGFNGGPGKLPGFILFSIVLSLIGGFFGSVLAYIGNLLATMQKTES